MCKLKYIVISFYNLYNNYTIYILYIYIYVHVIPPFTAFNKHCCQPATEWDGLPGNLNMFHHVGAVHGQFSLIFPELWGTWNQYTSRFLEAFQTGWWFGTFFIFPYIGKFRMFRRFGPFVNPCWQINSQQCKIYQIYHLFLYMVNKYIIYIYI